MAKNVEKQPINPQKYTKISENIKTLGKNPQKKPNIIKNVE